MCIKKWESPWDFWIFLGDLPFHVGFFQDGRYPKMPQQQAIATEDYLGIPVGRYLAGLDTSGASPRLITITMVTD